MDKFFELVGRKEDGSVSENSLYGPSTKAEFLADEQKIVDAFLFNFVGVVAAYEAALKKEKILKYVRSDGRVRVDNISDDNHDISLVVKLMHDKDFFKTPQTAMQMTKFLARFKQGGIDSVDSKIVQGWLEGLKTGVLKKASLPIRRLADDLVETGDLLFFADRMRDLRKRYEVSGEFSRVTRGIFFKKSGRTRLDDPVDLANNPNASSDGSGGVVDNQKQDSDGPSNNDAVTQTAEPEPTTADTTAKPVSTKKDTLDDNDAKELALAIVRGATTAEEAKSRYKITPDNRKVMTTTLQYGSLFRNNESTLVERVEAMNRAASIIPLLTKKQGEVLQKKLANYMTKVFKSGTRVGNINDEFEKIEAAIKADPIMKMLDNKSQEMIPPGNFLYRGASLLVADDDPEMTTLGQRNAEIIKMAKDAPEDNWASAASAIKFFSKAQVRIPTKIIAYFTRIFVDDPAMAKHILVHSNKHLFPEVDGKTIYIPNERDPIMNADWNPWENNKFMADYLNSIGIHHIEGSERIALDISDSSVPSRAEEIANAYENDRELFYNALQILPNLENRNMIEGYIDNAMANWAKDVELQKVVAEIIRKSNLPKATSIGLKLLLGSAPGGNTASYISTDKMTISDHQIVINEFVKLGINYIKESPRDFVDQWIGVGFRAVDIEQHSVQDAFIDYSASAGEPNFPKWFVNWWFDEIEKVAKSGEIKAGYSGRFENLLGFQSALIVNPGPLIELVNARTLENIRVNIIKSFGQKGSGSGSFKTIMNIASHGGEQPYTKMTDEVKEALDKILEKFEKDSPGDFQQLIRSSGSVVDVAFYEKYLKPTMGIISPTGLVRILKTVPEDSTIEHIVNEFVRGPDREKDLLEASASDFFYLNEKTIFIEKMVQEKIQKDISETVRDTYRTSIELETITGPKAAEEYPKLSKDDRVLALNEALKIIDDPKIMKKLTTDYRESLPAVKNAMMDLVDEDRFEAERIYESMSKSMRRQIASEYMQRKGFIMDAQGALMTQTADNPIISYEKLDNKRIKEILKYNNVITEETKLKDSVIKNFDTMDHHMETENEVPFEPLRVEQIEDSEEDLKVRAASYHLTKRNKKHGKLGLKFIRSFNVAIPLQQDEQAQWMEDHPDTEVINPMFHGTGSVAASMILRYGFRVISSGDASVVGRMLGDGVYGAIHIDKAQQYIGDSGFTRRPGTKGYIFEMNAALGKEGKDYKVAGLNNDGIRSPEWVAFTPNAQYRIFKAHEVEIVTEREIDQIVASSPREIQESKQENQTFPRATGVRFKDFKRISEATEEGQDYTTFTFINGVIPVARDKFVDFEDFEGLITSDKVTLEPSAYGPTVVIRKTKDTANYMLTSVTDLAVNHEDLFEEFLKLIK